jgi:predicted component of viral defense system (DUF524 family)
VSAQITYKAYYMKQKKTYSSKFTTEADLSNKCNIIWDRKFQETETRKEDYTEKNDKKP